MIDSLLKLLQMSNKTFAAFSLLMIQIVVLGCGSLSENRKPETLNAGSPAIEQATPAVIPGALDLELTKFTYPWPVKQYHFECQKQSLQMSYMDLNPARPNGQTVVLLHGKNFGSNYWEQIAEALAEKGFRVIMPDQVGFGKSSKPQVYQFSLHALSENTQGLLKSLGLKKYAVVGHSMGGMLAIRFALMYPKQTEKLVLLNPLGLEDWRLSVPYQTVDELYHQELHSSPESLRTYMRANYFGGEWRPEYDRLTEISVGWMKSPDYNQIAWVSALTTDMIFTQPVIYEIAKISVPTLLVIGQRDRTALGKAWISEDTAKKLGDYPTLGRKAQRQIPGALLIEIASAGHIPQIENFVKVRDALFVFLAKE